MKTFNQHSVLLMNKLHISPDAKSDLTAIKAYITEELASPQSAKNVVSKIVKNIRDLAQFAEIGASLSSILSIETDYRYLVSGNYLVFYRYEKHQEVYIDRVLYGRCDYVKILFGDAFKADSTHEIYPTIQ